MYLNVFPRTATISQIKDDTKWPVFFVHLSDFRYRKFTSVCYPHLGELDLVV